jgi:hypothetical protein
MVDWGSFGNARDELAGPYSQFNPTAGTFENLGSFMNSLGGVGSQDLVNSTKRGMANIEKFTYNLNNAGPVPYTSASVSIPNGQTCVFTCQFSLSEFLMVPIFNFCQENGISLTHVSQIQLNFTLGNISSMFSTGLLIDANNNIALSNTTQPEPGLVLGQPTFNNAYPLNQSSVILNMEYITPPAGSNYGNISKP